MKKLMLVGALLTATTGFALTSSFDIDLANQTDLNRVTEFKSTNGQEVRSKFVVSTDNVDAELQGKFFVPGGAANSDTYLKLTGKFANNYKVIGAIDATKTIKLQGVASYKVNQATLTGELGYKGTNLVEGNKHLFGAAKVSYVANDNITLGLDNEIDYSLETGNKLDVWHKGYVKYNSKKDIKAEAHVRFNHNYQGDTKAIEFRNYDKVEYVAPAGLKTVGEFEYRAKKTIGVEGINHSVFTDLTFSYDVKAADKLVVTPSVKLEFDYHKNHGETNGAIRFGVRPGVSAKYTLY